MKQAISKRLLATAAIALGAVALLAAANTSESRSNFAENRYIGAKKCKSCHKSDESGNQYGAWEHARHSKAFETLASDKALEAGKTLGIAEPQKADECLKCHTTAFGADAKLIKKGFKADMGVQCESCHGPGEQHMKTRFAAASGDVEVPIEPSEIISAPKEKDCRGCHNPKSPTFEKFCFYEMFEKIRHPRPDSKDDLERLVCGCGDACACVEECPDDGCAVPKGKLGQ